MASLEGKLALVTGGGSGIGRSVCQLLDREGARVVVADLNEAGAQETVNLLKSPGDHFAVRMDVSKKASVTQSVDAAVKAYGAPPSLMVNCAGYIDFIPLVDLEEASFDRMINVLLKGSFLVTQALAKAVKAAGIKQGSFVLISSMLAHIASETTGHYSAAKAGVLALSKTFSKELAPDGIRVNTVLPGMVETAIMPKEVFEQRTADVLPSMSIKRAGRPEEIAEMVLFLLSERSSYITGAEFCVSGGS
ncbi:(3R)-3-hydroxyacyl-CoA dehydrogenase-like [Oratosquilla oratoria]|uniref:(3R)-3-hydroxyacyl-CoA dehydrogenase-like n=1 Tax=Oratosquilla oratoria TaxID=337810 RepID=UPI003F76034E